MRKITLLGNNITHSKCTFVHGDNGSQEFYEFTPGGEYGDLITGILRNHGERHWVVYAIQGDRVTTLNTATNYDDRREEQVLFGVAPLDPDRLLRALTRLWNKHHEGILDIPDRIVRHRRPRGRKVQPFFHAA